MTAAFLASGGFKEERAANLLDGGVPYYDIYETSDGKHMSRRRAGAAVLRRASSTLLGVKDTAPDRYDADQADALRALITETFLQRTQAEWVEVFEGTDACVAGIIPLTEAVEHPHLKARGTFVEHDGLLQPAPAPALLAHRRDHRPPRRERRRQHPRGAHRLGHRRRRRADRVGSCSPGMKPFLFLGTRAEDDAADSEYAAVLRCSGLDESDVRRVRLERDPLGEVDLDDWSGIILGGGPFNVSDPEDDQVARPSAGPRPSCATSPTRVVEADFPFLGACYGIGVLGTLRGGAGRPDVRRADLGASRSR